MTKKIILSFVFVSGFVFFTISYGQKTCTYIADSTIKMTVDKNIELTDFPASTSINFKEILNDSIYSDNYTTGKNFGAITKAVLSNDTIFITSFLMARKASLGYKIILTNGSCLIKYFSLADEDIYTTDTIDRPKYLIYVSCQTTKLIVAQRPQFKTGELIEGMIELTTNDFWSFNNGHNTKVNVKLKGYFKTSLVKLQPGEKDIFSLVQ
ncbi:MAG: hypothetical protein ABI691_00645 [Ginsengibacter sp.]